VYCIDERAAALEARALLACGKQHRFAPARTDDPAQLSKAAARAA